MKPPRIPKYLEDAPLVDWQGIICELVMVRRVGPLGGWWCARPCWAAMPGAVDDVVPLTETARQVLAGEWR